MTTGMPTISPSPTQPTGKVLARRLLALPGPAPDQDGRPITPTRTIASTIAEPSSKMGEGRRTPRLLRKAASPIEMLSLHPGQRQHDQPPEDDLQQDRDVAGELDPDPHDAAHQEVVREPEDPGHEADDRGGDDAHHGDQIRVERADDERLPVGRGGRVIDQALVDVEVCGIEQEAVAGGEAGLPEVGDRVRDDKGDETRHPEHDQNLEDDAAGALVGPGAAYVEAAATWGRRFLAHGGAALLTSTEQYLLSQIGTDQKKSPSRPAVRAGRCVVNSNGSEANRGCRRRCRER